MSEASDAAARQGPQEFEQRSFSKAHASVASFDTPSRTPIEQVQHFLHQIRLCRAA